MTSPPPIVALDSGDGAAIVAELRASGGITVLLGSAISSFAPTSLPAGMPLAKAIAQRLAEGGVSRPELLNKLLSATAFEHVMERCPQPEKVRAVLARRFRDVRPNPIHVAFARLAAAGVVRHLVTTNYDVGLEAAFARAAPPAGVSLVRGKREALEDGDDPAHVLFKIHGCASEGFAPEMAFRLRDEAQLPDWKRETLRRVVAGRPLVVVAYSGMDFEICPELARMGASRLVWLHFDKLDDMTANAWRVVHEAGATVLLGSAQALANALRGRRRPVRARWAPASADALVTKLFADFSEGELDAWRARLFGEIGCGRDAVAAADRLLARARTEAARGEAGVALAHALSLRGRGLFHMGRYLDGAADYARAARLFRRLGDLHELRVALNGVAECNRCAGRFGRSLLALGALRRLARRARGTPEAGDFEADALMLGVLLARPLYQLASKVPEWRGLRRLRERLRRGLRERARRGLARVSSASAASGNWLQLQQVELWTRRYHLRWEDVHAGPMSPLPSREGYGQLGYFVAQVMAMRDALEGAGPDGVPPARVNEMLEELLETGAFPEAWKLARAAERSPGAAVVEPCLRERVSQGWRECQLTPWIRLAFERGLA